MEKAVIFDIQRGSYVDGPGIRTTVFFKGCNLRCDWCHNPEGQSSEKQLLFYKNKCGNCGKCKEVCPYRLDKCDLCGKCVDICPNAAREICGKTLTSREILKEILKDKTFFDVSGGGATFSGGECMLQIGFLEEILRLCKENGINTAVDTAGNVGWEYLERILPYTDLFLYDVKCFTEELHKSGTGVSNRLILANLKKLSDKKAKIIIRIPLIPTFNDSEKEFKLIADFLRPLNIEKIEVLPYHGMGERKWSAIGSTPTLYPVPSENIVNQLSKLLI